MPGGAAASIAALVFVLLAGAPPRDSSAQASAGQAPSAIAASGLLPVYGVDLPIDVIETAWSTVAPGGFTVVRFAVNAADAAASAERVATLCDWATAQNAALVPVLARNPIDASFAGEAAATVGAIASRIRSAHPDRAEAYNCIQAYQIAGALNDPAQAGGLDAPTAQLRLLQAAAAVRRAEAAALAGSGLAATPLAAAASFDAPLIAAGLQAPAPLSDEEHAAALETLVSYLREVAASPDIDRLVVDYRPGSAGAGEPARMAALARDLAAAFPQKVLVLSTGMPGDLGSAESQQRFYALAFATIADARVAAGPDARLLGMFFDGAAEEPAAQALTAIATAVDDAHAETPAAERPPADAPGADGGGDSALVAGTKDRVQQFLFGLLDRSLEKIGNGLLSGEPQDAGYADPGSPVAEPPAPAVPPLSIGKIYVAPNKPLAGYPAKISVGIENGSADTPASGLTVALIDHQGGLLATAPSGTVSPAMTTMVDLQWTPASAGTVTVEAILADEHLMEIARSAPTPIAIVKGQLEIADAQPGAPPSINPAVLARMPFPLPIVMSVTAGDMGHLSIGQPASAVVSLRNPYGRPLDSITATLVIDGRAVSTRAIRSMAAGQVRSIVFPLPAFTRAGGHDLRVTMSSGRARVRGEIRTRVDVRARASAVTPARSPDLSPRLRPPMRPPQTRPQRPARTPERAEPVRCAPAFDLRVTGLATAPARVVAGQPFALRVSVRNMGAAPSAPAQVTCAAGRMQARVSLAALAPGQQRDAICPLRAPAIARFGVGVTVSSAGDADPSNNRASITVTPVQRRGGR